MCLHTADVSNKFVVDASTVQFVHGRCKRVGRPRIVKAKRLCLLAVHTCLCPHFARALVLGLAGEGFVDLLGLSVAADYFAIVVGGRRIRSTFSPRRLSTIAMQSISTRRSSPLPRVPTTTPSWSGSRKIETSAWEPSSLLRTHVLRPSRFVGAFTRKAFGKAAVETFPSRRRWCKLPIASPEGN